MFLSPQRQKEEEERWLFKKGVDKSEGGGYIRKALEGSQGNQKRPEPRQANSLKVNT